MNDELIFTGERYIPEYFLDSQDEIIKEHENRYKSIKNIIKNKLVLDAACGTGYGSYEISKYAQKVIGIDISNETIKYAKKNYKRENLDFITASVTDLPFQDNSFDVITSFETIEHISEKQQLHFLDEIVRVLKGNGLLIISTPDKLIYSDQNNYTNEFHIKEFYEKEFYVFLNKFFKNIKFYYQSDEICNLIYSPESKEVNISEINDLNIKGKYIIAVCSNHTVNNNQLNIDHMIIDNKKLINLKNRVLELQDDIDKKNNWTFNLIEELNKKNKELTTKEQNIQTLNEELTTKEQNIQTLNEELTTKEQNIQTLNEELVDIYMSKSWKITRPLRELMRKFKLGDK